MVRAGELLVPAAKSMDATLRTDRISLVIPAFNEAAVDRAGGS